MSRADIFALNARQAARRVCQTPADYACSLQVFRRRSDAAVWITLAAGFCAAIAAAIWS